MLSSINGSLYYLAKGYAFLTRTNNKKNCLKSKLKQNWKQNGLKMVRLKETLVGSFFMSIVDSKIIKIIFENVLISHSLWHCGRFKGLAVMLWPSGTSTCNCWSGVEFSTRHSCMIAIGFRCRCLDTNQDSHWYQSD